MNIPDKKTFVATLNMPYGEAKNGKRVFGFDRWLARTFLHAIGNPELRMTLWDGVNVTDMAPAAAVGMVLHDRGALLRLLVNPLLYFGDDYCAGRIEIDGELVRFMETVYRSMTRTKRFQRTSDPDAYRRYQPNLNSLSGSRCNIHHHYDIG
ncbi:MAG: hypothetical protein PHH28_16800, partial [Desulfuromonadaceae bacterium]|nr:hypothetical protein [Desulfuromonadaceae bacterium]